MGSEGSIGQSAAQCQKQNGTFRGVSGAYHTRVTQHARVPPSIESSYTLLGFDHGVGHPLLHLCDAKAPHCRKNKAFKGLCHYSEWPKVADAVIKALFYTILVTVLRTADDRR